MTFGGIVNKLTYPVIVKDRFDNEMIINSKHEIFSLSDKLLKSITKTAYRDNNKVLHLELC